MDAPAISTGPVMVPPPPGAGPVGGVEDTIVVGPPPPAMAQAPAQPPAQPPVQAPVQPVVPPPKQSGSNRGLLALIACLLAVLLVGGGVFAWQSFKSDDEEVAADRETPAVDDSQPASATPSASTSPSASATPSAAPSSATASAAPKPVVPKAVTLSDAAGDMFVQNDPNRPSSDDIGDMTTARIVPTGAGAGRIEITFPNGVPNYVVNVYLNVNGSKAPEYLVHANFQQGRFVPMKGTGWIKGNTVEQYADYEAGAAANFPNIPAAGPTSIVIPFKFSAAELPSKTIALCVQSIQRNAGDIDQYDYIGDPVGDGTTQGRRSWTKPVRVLS